MRVESIASRLEFNERRARARRAVVYKAPDQTTRRRAAATAASAAASRSAPASRHIAAVSSAQPPRLHAAAVAHAAGSVTPPTQTAPADGSAGDGQRPGSGAGSAGGRTARQRRRGERTRRRPASGHRGAAVRAPQIDGRTEISRVAVDQMDAMDRMDDDGSPESEDTRGTSAAEHVEQARDRRARVTASDGGEPTRRSIRRRRATRSVEPPRCGTPVAVPPHRARHPSALRSRPNAAAFRRRAEPRGSDRDEDRASSFSATVRRSTAAPSCTRATSPSTSRATREVEVLTTCATDYVTWRNELRAGRRARSTACRSAASSVKHERDPLRVRHGDRTASSSSVIRSATSSTGSTPKGRQSRR